MATTIKELEKQFVEAITSINLKLEALELKQKMQEADETIKHEKKTVTETKTETKETKDEHFEYPIPPEYREIVDTLLNKHFRIFIDYASGNTDFNIVVPEKYSIINSEAKRSAGNMDRRRKIIPPFAGTNGVKEYVEAVWKSFNPSYQAMIVSDRNTDTI